VRKLVPVSQEVLRLDERLSLRLAEPAPYLQVDIWEERTGLFDFGSKAPAKKLLGQCYVPLEPRFSRRPCTWSIVSSHGDKEHSPNDVGYLCVKFGLATSPLPVRNLRIVEGTAASTEVTLAWEPPANDGGTPLRGYRVEARQSASVTAARRGIGFAEETPRTASAPAVPEPSVTMRGLHGNTGYTFRIWAVSEAGPGPGADVSGRTGPVAPGICGTLVSLGGEVLRDEAPIHVEWSPPADTGGAAIVAYRLRLRPLYRDCRGDVYPAEGWLDLGLTEHRGEPAEVQRAMVQREKLPPSAGCLCSVNALNTAGCTGPPTKEVPVFFESRVPESCQAWEYSPGSGGSHQEWPPSPGLSPSEPVGMLPPDEPLGALGLVSPPPLPALMAPGHGSDYPAEHLAGAYGEWDADEVATGPAPDADGGSGVPGVCGTPRAVVGDSLRSEAPLYVEWRPPADAGGGATVVAYRLSLRPLFYNGTGDTYPGESSIDLGLTVHQGGPTELQNTSVQCDRLPQCPGCLCSIAALNAAGITGPSTSEVPVFFDSQAMEPRALWELGSVDSSVSRHAALEDRGLDYAHPLGAAQLPRKLAMPGAVMLEQGDFGLDGPPPRRAAPFCMGDQASSHGTSSVGDGGSELYAQAVRALQRPGPGGGLVPADANAGVLMTPQHRILRNSSVSNYQPMQRQEMSDQLQGSARVQTLQGDVNGRHPGYAGSTLRPGPATFGLGSRGALVAGRPKPGG